MDVGGQHLLNVLLTGNTGAAAEGQGVTTKRPRQDGGLAAVRMQGRTRPYAPLAARRPRHSQQNMAVQPNVPVSEQCGAQGGHDDGKKMAELCGSGLSTGITKKSGVWLPLLTSSLAPAVRGVPVWQTEFLSMCTLNCGALRAHVPLDAGQNTWIAIFAGAWPVPSGNSPCYPHCVHVPHCSQLALKLH